MSPHSRWRRIGGGASLVLAIALSLLILFQAWCFVSSADAAPAAAVPCPDVPVIGTACQAATGPVGAAGDAAGSVAGGLASDAAKGIFDALTTWMVDAAKDVVGRVGAAVDHSTRPDVEGPWFQPSYGRMVAVGGALLLPFVLLGVIQALLRQDLAALGRLVFVKLPIAGVGMVAAGQGVSLLVSVTDQLSGWVGQAIGSDGAHFGKGVADAFATLTATGGPGGALVFVLALVVTLIALVLWVELVLRQAAVLAATLFLPLGFAGLAWPASGTWLKRLAEGIAAFVLAKLVITAVIGLAAAGLADGGEDFSKVILGAALLLLATFAPYVLLKVIPVAEVGAVAAIEGLRSRPLQTATNTARGASSVSDLLRAGSRGSSMAAGGGAAGPASPAGAVSGVGLAAAAAHGAGRTATRTGLDSVEAIGRGAEARPSTRAHEAGSAGAAMASAGPGRKPGTDGDR